MFIGTNGPPVHYFDPEKYAVSWLKLAVILQLTSRRANKRSQLFFRRTINSFCRRLSDVLRRSLLFALFVEQLRTLVIDLGLCETLCSVFCASYFAALNTHRELIPGFRDPEIPGSRAFFQSRNPEIEFTQSRDFRD